MLIILSACRVDQMDRGNIAFAATDRTHAAQTANCQNARQKPMLYQLADYYVERNVVTTHDHHIRRPRRASNQGYLYIAVGIERRRERIDFDKPVCLGEARYRPGALAGGKSNRALIALDQ